MSHAVHGPDRRLPPSPRPRRSETVEVLSFLAAGAAAILYFLLGRWPTASREEAPDYPPPSPPRRPKSRPF